MHVPFWKNPENRKHVPSPRPPEELGPILGCLQDVLSAPFWQMQKAPPPICHERDGQLLRKTLNQYPNQRPHPLALQQSAAVRAPSPQPLVPHSQDCAAYRRIVPRIVVVSTPYP